MDGIPELLLVPLSKFDTLLIIDALNEQYAYLKAQGTPRKQLEQYERVISKLVEALDEIGNGPPSVN